MKIAVVGAGLMGRAVVFDLAHNPDVGKIGLYDIDLRQARHVAGAFGGGKTVAGRLDAGDKTAVARCFKGFDAVVSAVTYRYNAGLAKAAIRNGAHFVDMGGNNDVVAEEFTLHGAAKRAGVVVTPDCGLAPGMVSVIAAGDLRKFDRPDSLFIRVGGLPQKPKPPLEYQMVFSAEGLVNEYTEPVVAVRNGKKIIIDPMTEIERLTFRGLGTFEAFATSGGISTLPKTYGRVLRNIDYKTIRFPGHCAKFKTMLDLGLGEPGLIDVDGVRVSPRSAFKKVLDNRLTFGEPDMVLVRIVTEGVVGDRRRRQVSEIVDYYDRRTGLTAMMRCTAFPAAIIAAMAASGKIAARGVMAQETAVDPDFFERELAARKINVSRRWMK